MGKKIKWGILGTGRIANDFAYALQFVNDAELVSVGSRSIDKANEFAKQYKIPNIHGSYIGLASDSDVDIVYIATPHVLHCENTLLCLNHGKAVLCEKPFAMNEKEVLQMVQKAKEKNLFLMEALWTRFLPSLLKTEELIKSGRLGELVHIKSDFGFKAKPDPAGRMFNRDLGGGSLLDIGIYPVFITLLLLGMPDEINSKAILSDQGIDTNISMNFKYNKGQLASLYSTILAESATETEICGTLGRIRFNRKWHVPTSIIFTENNKEELFEFDVKGNGYEYEAREATKCLQLGLNESPLMTHEFSLQLIKVLDEIRNQNGIKYKSDSI